MRGMFQAETEDIGTYWSVAPPLVGLHPVGGVFGHRSDPSGGKDRAGNNNCDNRDDGNDDSHQQRLCVRRRRLAPVAFDVQHRRNPKGNYCES
jgi:hypothetical protein